MKAWVLRLNLVMFCGVLVAGGSPVQFVPISSEVITPRVRSSFDRGGHCRKRCQGGNPRLVEGCLVFDGAVDGNRQVDPQIAVGGGYVLHATNNGLIIYDKQGKCVNGVHMQCFYGGIDPKIFFDVNNRVFGFAVWKYWDKANHSPIHISVSASADPKGAWSTYAIASPDENDGGGIGQSRQWLVYAYPSKKDAMVVFSLPDAIKGKPVTVYHFKENMGAPALNRDDWAGLYFLKITTRDFIITRMHDKGDGTPVAEEIARKPHGMKYFGYPPRSPQKGTPVKTASGDRNPKNLVLMNGCLWFSQTINCNGRAAVQWTQLKLDGTVVQRGLIASPTSSYIQTTLAVNRRNDVLVGFQETSKDMYISPRMAWRLAEDPPGKLRGIIKLGEGQGGTDGAAWGDYSGSCVDGDNLMDLWTVQSITDESGHGDTVIARVKPRGGSKRGTGNRPGAN